MSADKSGDKVLVRDAPLAYAESLTEADLLLFRDLVQEHTWRLKRFIIKHIGDISEAEDIAQQTFVEAARSYQQFRGESQLSTWLYGIALNLVRNYLSRAPERRYAHNTDAELINVMSTSASPEDLVYGAEMMVKLQESLSELPETLSSVLLMVGLDSLSYEEAAVLLTVPVGTVRSRLSRARSALRIKLAQKGLTLDF